MDNIVVSRN